MTIEQKLKSLREEWKNSPQKREIILRRVQALKYSQQPYKNKQIDKNEKLVADIIDSLT